MATIHRDSDFGGDRYKYDRGMCSVANGWAQFDTTQDASYYGNWVNPFTYEMFSFTEGDTAHTKCDNEADFVETLRQTVEWHKERGYFLGIDPGISRPEIKQAFERLGFSELVH